MHQAGYRYKLWLTEPQQQILRRYFGHGRHIRNQYLAAFQATHGKDYDIRALRAHPDTSFTAMSAWLTQYKQVTPWLYEAPAVALQQEMRQLARAFTAHKARPNKVGRPGFSSRRGPQSLTMVDTAFGLQPDSQGDLALWISEPRGAHEPLGLLKVIWSRPLPSEPTTVTITQDAAGSYYVSFTVTVAPRATQGTKEIGLDMGVITFAKATLEALTVSSMHFLRRSEDKLARLQQQLAKTVKGSYRYRHYTLRIAQLHRRIANQRRDYLHQCSTWLVRQCRLIAIENLDTKGLSQKAWNAKSLLDQGWSSFLAMLCYKAKLSTGCHVAVINRFYPSTKTCSVCQHVHQAITSPDIRDWNCPACGSHHDRDLNAATNLLRLAQGYIADWTSVPSGVYPI